MFGSRITTGPRRPHGDDANPIARSAQPLRQRRRHRDTSAWAASPCHSKVSTANPLSTSEERRGPVGWDKNARGTCTRSTRPFVQSGRQASRSLTKWACFPTLVVVTERAACQAAHRPPVRRQPCQPCSISGEGGSICGLAQRLRTKLLHRADLGTVTPSAGRQSGRDQRSRSTSSAVFPGPRPPRVAPSTPLQPPRSATLPR